MAKITKEDFINSLKEILKDKVSDVKLSNRLKSHPVCLASDEQLSIEMEKVLKQLNQESVKANKILEINPNHELFTALTKLYEDKKDITDYADLLYQQALLIAGLPIEDPVAYSNKITKLMLESMK